MSKKENPQESEDKRPTGIIKQHEYDAFLQWMALSPNLRGIEPDKLRELGVEETDIELLSIRTMGQFAERYGVHRDSLTDWKKKASFNEALKDKTREKTFHKWYARICDSFSAHVVKHGDAARVEKWMQLFAGEGIGEVTIETKIKGDTNLSSEEIASMVAMKLKRSRGINVESASIEDVEHEEVLPSTQEYDFEAIEAKHKQNGHVEPKQNGHASKEVKNALKEALLKAKNKKK